MNIDTLTRLTPLPLAYGIAALSGAAIAGGVPELLALSAAVNGTVGTLLLAIVPTFDSTLEAHKPKAVKTGLSLIGGACFMAGRLLI